MSFGQQAGMPYSRPGHTKALFNGKKADFERFWKKRIIIKINRYAFPYLFEPYNLKALNLFSETILVDIIQPVQFTPM